MRQRIDGDVEGELLAVVGTDAFAFVARVIGAEGAAQTILAHDGHEVAFIEKPFELDVARFVETTDALDFVEGAINQVIVRNRFDLFVGKNAAEFAAPGG